MWVSISSRKALQVIENVEKILAIELLTAAQAFEFRKPMKSGLFLEEVHKEVRNKVAFADKDRVFADDIEMGIDMIRNGSLLKVVEQVRKKEKISLDTPFSDEFEDYWKRREKWDFRLEILFVPIEDGKRWNLRKQ